MNNFRNTVKSDFTIIPNEVVNNSEISWKAKGIFCYLASKPDDWRFSMDEIIKNATDQMGALKSGCKELEQAGYLERRRMFGDDRKFIGWEWILKLPSKIRQTENPSDGKSVGRETASYTNTELTNTELTNTNNTNTFSLRQKTDWFIDFWNRKHGTEVKFTEKKQKQVSARLKIFTSQEIIKAINNRLEDDWFHSEGIKFLGDWDSFWRNDEKVERYLNRKENINDDLPF